MRGKGSYAPFLPGGLEPEVALKITEGYDAVERNGDGAEDEEEEEEGTWKSRPPGFKRGMKLDGGRFWECFV